MQERIESLTLRSFRGQQELPEMARIAQASLAADGVDWTMTVDELANDFAHPEGWLPERDVVVAEIDGEIAGWAMPYTFCSGDDGGTWCFHWGVLLPEYRRRGIGTAMLRHIQGRLRSLLEQRGEAATGSFVTEVEECQTGELALLAAEGYLWRRGEFYMSRPLDEPIPDVPVPAGIELRSPRHEECREVLLASMEAFVDLPMHVADDPDIRETRIARWMTDPYRSQPAQWIVALDGDEIAGSICGYIDPTENERFGRMRGYTERISVRRPWRGRGIASAMIARHLRGLRDAGMTESALSVDTENPSGALRIYERLGFRCDRRSGMYVRRALPEVPSAG